MTLVERIESWFLREEALSREEQEALLRDRIVLQHRRLGRQLYFRGGASVWYRLWGKTPRVRTTLAEEAESLTAERKVVVIRNALAYTGLPWWQKLFSAKRRDYELFLYFGGQRYLSTGHECAPLSPEFFPSYQLLLSRSRYAKNWYGFFLQEDRLRVSNNRLGEIEAKLLPLKERLEAVKAKLELAQEKARKAHGWGQIASYTVSAAKSGDKTVISSTMVSTQALAQHLKDCAKALVDLRVQVLLLLHEERGTGFSVSEGGASLVQLKKEVSCLVSELSKKSKEAEEESRSMLQIADKLYNDSLHVACRILEALSRRVDEWFRQFRKEQQVAVQSLAEQSLRLDEAERRIRGMTKFQRLREPLAWTEEDILSMRLQILQEAYRTGIYHLLWPLSRAFQISPVYGMNSEGRNSSELNKKSEEARSMFEIAARLESDSRPVGLTMVEVSRMLLKASILRLKASRLSWEVSNRRLQQAAESVVQSLEERSLWLDEAERRIRGMTRFNQLRHPLGTEGDILRMRLQILEEAQRRGVYDLLRSSRVFQVSPVFSAIFNPEKANTKEEGVKYNKFSYN